MELTLKTRWIEHKSCEQTLELNHGMPIEYYGNGVANIEYGVIEETEDAFQIRWDNITTPTKIDDSEFSNNILKDCGFGQ